MQINLYFESDLEVLKHIKGYESEGGLGVCGVNSKGNSFIFICLPDIFKCEKRVMKLINLVSKVIEHEYVHAEVVRVLGSGWDGDHEWPLYKMGLGCSND